MRRAPGPPRQSAGHARPSCRARAETAHRFPDRKFLAARSFHRQSFWISTGVVGAAAGAPGIDPLEGAGAAFWAVTGTPGRISTYETTLFTSGVVRAAFVAISSSSWERAEPI